MALPDPRHVQDLVEAALAVDPPSRHAYIAEASHGDEALSGEALRVLRELSSINDSRDSDDVTKTGHDALNGLVQRSSSRALVSDFAGTERFDVIRRIGAGGFGTVYEAYDKYSKRSVAIKVLRRLEFAERFKREFRALAEIRHESLVPIYELFAEPTWFFTMELVNGVNILEYVAAGATPDSSSRMACDVTRLRNAAAQLYAGIRVLHTKGMLHRDIKPSNVLVANDGRVQLLDFGLIWEIDRSAIDSAIWAGTPGYLAPELMAQFPATPASDWYSFGVVLYQCLVGTLPTADVLRSIEKSLDFSPPYPPEVPDDLKQLCTGLLCPDPEKRLTDVAIAACVGPAGVAPRRAISRSSTTCPIGRESHLERLNELFSGVCRGHTIVANVHGSSGVGKTTLLRAFARTVQSDFNTVLLSGRCHQNETVPYKALDDLVDGLARYLRTLGDSAVESLTPHDVTSLGRIFPTLGRVERLHRVRRKANEPVDIHELRDRAFASLRDLLMRLSEKRVVVIALDDLQWGDLDSAAFLSTLLTDGTPPSLLFVSSYRSEDRDTSPFLQQWYSLLAAVSNVTVVELPVEPLAVLDAARVASELLEGEAHVKIELATSIAIESGGSPFLIDQMARHARVGLDTTASLIEVIARQVLRLSDGARRLLECISIAGEPIPCAIANRAAGIERESIVELSHLTSERLIRIRETRGTKQAEPYHHRISETLVTALPSDRLRALHLALARELDQEHFPSAALLATHFRLGGEVKAARQYSILAAEQSMQALAFDRAAHWYRTALDLEGVTPDPSVLGRLAYALVLAGYGVRAAETYLQAAEYASATERFQFRRLAAEQMLRFGLLTKGLELLETVARDVGVWLPKNRAEMMASMLWQRTKLKCRGLRFRTRSRDAIASNDITVLDVYWSLVIGFTALDTTRSFECQARHLSLALQVGDSDHIAIALAAEAAFRASLKRRNTHVVEDLLARARQLASGTTHPQVAGVVATFEGLSALVSGEFKHAQRLAEAAKTVLTERCTGVMWESATNALVHATATFHLGEWRKFEDPAAILNKISNAAEQNNAYEINVMSSRMHISALSADCPDVALTTCERLQTSLSSSPQEQFQLPHLWLMGAYADVALYQQDAVSAWESVERDWHAFSRSLHRRLEYADVFADYLRARTAIAMAAITDDSRMYSAEAVKCLRRLDRHRVAWARVYGAVARAGLASLTDHAQTLVELETAERLARDASMLHCVAACQYRRGKLLRGVTGGQLLADSERWANEQGVVHPSRMFDVFLPGRWNV